MAWHDGSRQVVGYDAFDGRCMGQTVYDNPHAPCREYVPRKIQKSNVGTVNIPFMEHMGTVMAHRRRFQENMDYRIIVGY